jgi:methylated-DNA-[protein]-cysteine S-methyltransferase
MLARRIKNPKAARAVGAACGANPVPLFVPCHRVVAGNGGLGGFTGGLAIKKALLRAENRGR